MPSLVNNALHCLEKGMANGGDTTYTAALSTYALALLEHPRANDSLKLLMDRATRNHVRNTDERRQSLSDSPSESSRSRISAFARRTFSGGRTSTNPHSDSASRWQRTPCSRSWSWAAKRTWSKLWRLSAGCRSNETPRAASRPRKTPFSAWRRLPSTPPLCRATARTCLCWWQLATSIRCTECTTTTAWFSRRYVCPSYLRQSRSSPRARVASWYRYDDVGNSRRVRDSNRCFVKDYTHIRHDSRKISPT